MDIYPGQMGMPKEYKTINVNRKIITPVNGKLLI